MSVAGRANHQSLDHQLQPQTASFFIAEKMQSPMKK